MTDELAWTDDGDPDAPVVVLGSSLGTTGAMWEPQLAGLTVRFRVVRYDHLGHAASPVPDGPYTLDRLGAAVVALLDRLDLDRVSYAGLSLGGLVGQWLAVHAPDRVDRLALLCTGAQFPPPQPWLDRAATVRAEGMAAVSVAVVQRWFTPAFAAASPEVVAAHRAMLESIPPEGYAGCCEVLATADLRDRVSGIRAPTLLVAGAQDPATPPAYLEALAAAIPGSRLQVLEPAAHIASVEQAERVTDLLLEHLGHSHAT